MVQFIMCGINLFLERDDPDDLSANTITLLFFVHPIVKIVFFAATSKMFYRTLAVWNNPNSHPLFAESNARYHAIAITKMRRLLMAVVAASIISTLAWTGLTFIGDSVKTTIDKETNETITVEVRTAPTILEMR